MTIKPEYEAACKYVLGSIKNVTDVVRSVREFFTHIDNAFALFRTKEEYLDLRSGEQEIGLYFGLSFWSTVLFRVISIIMAIFAAAFIPFDEIRVIGLLTVPFSIFWAVAGIALSLVICSALVYLSSVYSGAWKSIVAKIFAVLLIIGAVFTAVNLLGSLLSLVFAAIKIIASFSVGIVSVISSLFSLIEDALSIALCVTALNGLNKGIEYHR